MNHDAAMPELPSPISQTLICVLAHASHLAGTRPVLSGLLFVIAPSSPPRRFVSPIHTVVYFASDPCLARETTNSPLEPVA